jgi:hypothetical protein
VLARKFGLVAGICAGLYIATNPMFVENSRDLRGYSLATLCGLLATVLFFGPRTKWRLVLYGSLLGLAIAAHLYAGLVLVAHVLWIVIHRSWGDLRVLLPAWALASAIAVAANGYILWVDVTQHGFPPKLYDPAFPRDVLFYLLGAPSLLTIGLWLSAFGLGLWALRRERRVWASVLLVMAAVGLLWQLIQPSFLYPRFFVFVIPGVAYVLGAAIQRWKLLLAPAVLLGAVAAVVSQVPDYMTDPLALRQAAAVIAQANAAGRRACLVHSDEQVVGAYAASGFKVVSMSADLASCDLVVVASWGVDIPLRDLAATEFPRRTLYPAYYPTVVLER